MKKEIEELRRKLAEAEKRIEALEKDRNKIEYHFHSYPPAFQPYVPASAPMQLYPPQTPYPIITYGAGKFNGDGSSVRFVQN